MPDSARSTVTSATDAPPVTLLYLIKQVELAVRSRLDELATAHGITTIQYTALTVLERHPGVIAAQLARTSFVRAQSMTQLLDALERRGLVERVPDPSSRRQQRIFLTPAAHDLLDEMRQPAADIEHEMTAALTGDDVELLRELLHACRVTLAAAAS
ncbi:MarR family winged helix-turn-helix transcriptional regulator [Microbacterium terrisoli]|jgi:DNA-binding MarR family transcriptional regulator|uniref:MarR family winged helix-turn-helix transcriptional regulator n=1 Tax=Microbacterium terrisoli TaxID=3242192 RepID=UPI0028057261|nr:MarR family transcriptional regulator [Microbacterium protaetiae]